MPELPDIELYLHALRPRLAGRPVTAVRVASPFLVRTTSPDIQTLTNRAIRDLHRMGKRIVFDLDGPYLVIHLMIAGRFQWRAEGAAIPKRLGLMAIDVPGGSLLLTEAGSTFLLKPVAGREEDARKWLEEWARHGLPLSQQVRTFYEIGDTPERAQWMQCPYLPENGYGEIRVNSTARFPEAEFQRRYP